MATRTFAKVFITNANGVIVRKHPGDTIDTDLAKKLGLGEHLFEDADDPIQDALDELAVSGNNRNDHFASTTPERTGLGAMNVAQLQAYARDNGIAVGNATRKIDLLRVISEAETSRDAAAQTSADTAALEAEADVRESIGQPAPTASVVAASTPESQAGAAAQSS